MICLNRTNCARCICTWQFSLSDTYFIRFVFQKYPKHLAAVQSKFCRRMFICTVTSSAACKINLSHHEFGSVTSYSSFIILLRRLYLKNALHFLIEMWTKVLNSSYSLIKSHFLFSSINHRVIRSVNVWGPQFMSASYRTRLDLSQKWLVVRFQVER